MAMSFFLQSKKEIKVFDENISGFSPYNLHMEVNGVQTVQGPKVCTSLKSITWRKILECFHQKP